MKKCYIKPTMGTHESSLYPILAALGPCQVSTWKIESAAADYDTPSTPFMKVDNEPGSINMSGNDRGPFGGGASWEDIW